MKLVDVVVAESVAVEGVAPLIATTVPTSWLTVLSIVTSYSFELWEELSSTLILTLALLVEVLIETGKYPTVGTCVQFAPPSVL